MSDLSTISAGQVISASEARAGEIAACLERAFDAKFVWTAGEPSRLAAEAANAELAGPGIVLLFCHENMAGIALLPAASGVVPDWASSHDADVSERLQTLAHELSGLLFPSEFEPTDVAAAYVPSLNEALDRAAIEREASLVPFSLARADGVTGTMQLVWPVTRVETVYGAIGIPRRGSESAEVTLVPERPTAPTTSPRGRPNEAACLTSIDDLPAYARSLLKIDVPVMVNLATKRQAVGRILELGVGAIIQFDKSCDELLDLYVGNQRIAQGEAVKVGEKFGIRITTIALPEERFERVQPS